MEFGFIRVWTCLCVIAASCGRCTRRTRRIDIGRYCRADFGLWFSSNLMMLTAQNVTLTKLNDKTSAVFTVLWACPILKIYWLWSPYALWFLSSVFFFLFFPRLISAATDWMSTILLHMAWVSRLGSVTARHLVVGVSQTLWRWTEGATYVRQGDHHVGHWPTF